MVIAELRRSLFQQLAGSGIESATFESAELLCHVLELSRTALLALPPETVLSPEQLALLDQLTERRLRGEPLQYLLGEWSFYGRSFLTAPGVLIPRPETELLVDEALSFLKEKPQSAVLDLCCGSGCIGLTLALEQPCEVTLLDLSPSALELTRRNAERLCAPRCTLLQGDVLQPPAAPLSEQRFDLILCNPPYLRSDELAQLQREVTFEPALALDGGADGLLFYRALSQHWTALLQPGGLLLAEHGMGQGVPVAQMFTQAGLVQVQTRLDYAGLDRLTQGQRTR